MNKKILTTLFALCLLGGIQGSAFSNQLWDINEGISLFKAKKYTDALSFFEGYTRNNPNDTDGHYYLGIIYKNLGLVEKSNYHLQKSYELAKKPEKISVAQVSSGEEDSPENDYIDMANTYFDAGNYAKALQYADLTENINPNNTSSLILKTKIYWTQGNQSLAKVYFQKALLIDNELLNSIWAQKLGITAIPEYDFEFYNTKGLEYYYQGNPKTSIEYFNKAINLNPKSAIAYNNLAMAYIKLNDFENAKNTLNKALKADKDFNLTYINLAKLEDELDKVNKKHGANKRRENYLITALKVNPNSKYAYLELGNYYLNIKDYSKAVENFNNAIVIDDKFYEAFMGLGVCSVEQGNLNDGIRALRRAAELNKDGTKSPDLMYYLAKICILNNNLEEAKDYLGRAVEISENANYYYDLGRIYFKEQDYSSAKNAFTRALELDLNFDLEADIYNYFGLIEYKTFDTKKAVYMFKKAIELDNSKAMYAYNLAQAYKSLGDKAGYNAQMEAIASIKPRTAKDYLDLSTIYFDKSNSPMALKILDEGIAKFPAERGLWEAKLKLFKATKNSEAASALENEINTKFGKN